MGIGAGWPQHALQVSLQAAERAAQSALALAKRAPSASAELPAARRAASRLAAAQGRAPEAPNRQMALEDGQPLVAQSKLGNEQ